MDFSKIYESTNEKSYSFKIQHSVNEDNLGELTDLSNSKKAIFLAGPCPRKNYDKEWRTEKAYDILENLCFDGIVYNPTNKYFKSIDLNLQTQWEYEAMHRASAIVFNLDRTEEFPGFTSNVEIGYYSKYPNIFVCIPEGVTQNANRYIKILCEKQNIPVYETLEDTLAAAVRAINRPGKVWYTSDTHFGQERTLNLSKRPFNTVSEMDLELISNWNKRVMPNDIVYHLGDFGDTADYLNGLNFKEMNFITGNYERDKIPEIMKDIKKHKDINIFNNDECTVDSNTFHYILRHEPVIGKKIPKNTICIYGHIHGRQLIKTNGIDVGCDAHNYCPISQEDVDFFANALEKGYYDENVFSEDCK